MSGLKSAARLADTDDETVMTDAKGDVVPPHTVVFFDHTAMMSGGEIALLNLIQHIDRSRYTPVVLLSSDGPLVEKLVASGVETHVLPLDAGVKETRKDSLGIRGLLRPKAVWAIVRYAWRLARFLKARHADILHTNSLKSDVIGGIAGRLARVSVIWHVRDRIASDYLPGPAVKGFRILCRILPNYIVTNSEATLTTLGMKVEGRSAVIHSGTVRTYVRVVHDGVQQETPAALDPYTEHPDYPLIGLVGRISPWKGQHIFLQAAALIRREFPSSRFQIIGSAMFGEELYETEVHALTDSLNLVDCVEYTGFRTDVPALIQNLNILVHASTIGEPFGQVVVEGMIAGKPVVATDGGGVPEIVQDGVTGLLVPMGDVEAMAEAVMKLLRNPLDAEEMGRAGRVRVLENFTIELTARRVQAVYKEMLSGQQSFIA